ncbi:JAB domain-containing protein [Parasphingopyxis lamellibrachiae]|uniref:JAB domain-containing protein n=1 Tax=Parasphingopyxis lamellibrachiae TaxID=680125 RepID=UPI0013C31E97|nr:JAB domain-containing protein [Parasphingopyxis lamellibrachiae]
MRIDGFSIGKVAEICRPLMDHAVGERFIFIGICRNWNEYSIWTMDGGAYRVPIKLPAMLRALVEWDAGTVVLAHNHPSGRAEPSEADIHATHKIADALRLLDMRLADHLIFAGGNYYSFREDGRM